MPSPDAAPDADASPGSSARSLPDKEMSLAGTTCRLLRNPRFVQRDDLVELYWRFHPRFRFLKCQPKNAAFLDIGAGPGGLAFWRSWGSPNRDDIALYALDLAKGEHFHLFAGYALANLDESAIPYPDGRFDGIMMSHVIEHLRKPREALGEVARVLKPGGRFYMEWPTPETVHCPRRQTFLDRGLPVGTLNFHDDRTHLRTYSLDEGVEFLERNGLRTVEGGFVENALLEDELFTYGALHKDEEVLTYALWLKFRWSQYVIAEK